MRVLFILNKKAKNLKHRHLLAYVNFNKYKEFVTDDWVNDSVKAELKDLFRLDGCGFVIEL
jgi:hypothetical protein